MPLERHRQVAQLWDWLPAFRAAAEYESLQRAALALSVSPSALSRSIKRLEETLGQPVFTRSPTGLALTRCGAALLEATRNAMRLVHDALPHAGLREFRVAAQGPVLERLLFDAVLDEPEGLFVQIAVPGDDVSEWLRCGSVDLVLTSEPLEDRGLQVTALPPFVMVLAGRGEQASWGALDWPELRWPGATLISQGVDALVRWGERGRAAVHLPRGLVPPGWTEFEVTRTVPVFVARRQDLTQAPEPLLRLEGALRNTVQGTWV